MPSYETTPEFRRDAAEAWDFIFEQAGDLRADRVIDAITESLQTLAETPRIGTPRPDLSDAEEVRSFVARPYLIVYRPLPAGGILALRLYHTSRDPEGLSRS
ncbi:type II toxin-antitoxin system RelE/ParE family toxin [Rubrivirga sp.]|uniref:type II toxin-antitoxin system RelE/ParE family toxin n=1 Tax=Rubrivirga sp. TaxID=1885344 RepID=UPI003B5244FE